MFKTSTYYFSAAYSAIVERGLFTMDPPEAGLLRIEPPEIEIETRTKSKTSGNRKERKCRSFYLGCILLCFFCLIIFNEETLKFLTTQYKEYLRFDSVASIYATTTTTTIEKPTTAATTT